VIKIKNILTRKTNHCVCCHTAVRGTGPVACKNCIELAPCSAGIRNDLRLAGLRVPTAYGRPSATPRLRHR
jgi:hypothetical protein